MPTLSPHEESSEVQTPLSLLALPPEIRNTIYREVLVPTVDILITRKVIERETALLKVCHQIREEASSIFYGENKFKDWRRSQAATVISWIRLIGNEHAGMIQQLTVNYPISQASIIVAKSMRPLSRPRSFHMPELEHREFRKPLVKLGTVLPCILKTLGVKAEACKQSLVYNIDLRH